MKKKTKLIIALVGLLLIGVALFLVIVTVYPIGDSRKDISTRPIPNGLLRERVPERDKFSRYHPVDYSAPIATQ